MITTIGIDLAKTTLHAVAMDASGRVVQRRKLCRAKLVEWLANQGPCLIGMEACAAGRITWGARCVAKGTMCG